MSTNSIIVSSPSNSEMKTSLSDIRKSASSSEYSLDYPTLSEFTESTNEKMDAYTATPIYSTTFNQHVNQITQQETISISSFVSSSSTDETPLSFSSYTSPLIHIDSTTSISPVELSISNASHSTGTASDSSTTEDFPNVTKDQLSSFQTLSSSSDHEIMSSSYIDQQIISSSQSHSDFTTENIHDTTETISANQISTNDLLSLQLSTTISSQTDLSSSKIQTSKLNDITSPTYSSSIDSLVETTKLLDNTESRFTSVLITESLSNITNTISNDVTESTNSPSTLIQFSNQLLSSQSQQDLNTLTMKQNFDLTTNFNDQSSSKQITEHFDITTTDSEKLLSSTFGQTSTQTSSESATDQTLTSSFTSEKANQHFTSTIASATSDTIERISTENLQLSINQSTLSNTFSSTTTYSSTIYPTLTTTNTMSFNDSISSSGSFSNDMITTSNINHTDKLNQLSTTLSSSSDYSSLKDVISTESSSLNIHSIETTPKNIDKSFSSIQSTLIAHNQTSTIQIEYDSSTIKSSTESLNITSVSP
ncbi:unnamed protein product [Rotaria sordida]|nr:unnamed protein product [Rotaria sordida]